MPSGGPVYGYNLLAWLLDRPAERYDGEVPADRKRSAEATIDVVELVPAVPDLPFERAVVWLDREDALPRRLEILEQSGATRTLTLSKLRVESAGHRQAPSSSRCRREYGSWISESAATPGPPCRVTPAATSCRAAGRPPLNLDVLRHPSSRSAAGPKT